jgi:hypothetical protein
VQRLVRPRLGFKAEAPAQRPVAGVALWHRLRTGQIEGRAAHWRTLAAPCYTLAASTSDRHSLLHPHSNFATPPPECFESGLALDCAILMFTEYLTRGGLRS